MSAAWAICPVCGKILAVEVTTSPEQPVALSLHLKEHQAGTAGETSGRAAAGAASAAASAPRSAAADHPPRRSSSDRPHGRPRRGGA